MNISKLEGAILGNSGAMIYSTKAKCLLTTYNGHLKMPLASAAKLVIGFAIGQWVKEKGLDWNTQIGDIKFNPDEDSHIIYPHLQGRATLLLSQAVEVMIACHDNDLAHSVVAHVGGWERINTKIKDDFPSIHVTDDPWSENNCGSVEDLLGVLKHIYLGYQRNPSVWEPIINALIRQQEAIEDIPKHLHARMTGGLPNLIVDIGIIGAFGNNPLLYVIGAKNLPDRFTHRDADDLVTRVIQDTYEIWKKL